MPPSPGNLAPSWLKSLPVAPEFRPTAAEFADPVAYILRIEPAAAPFGICKVVPPHPPPPKRTTLANLTRSFADLHPDDPSPTFPTRHQQLGLCPRRSRPAIKPVWLSSHRYTLPQFEAKAGATRKALLSHLNVPASRQLSPLDVEALFWRAMADRPVTVEYATDMSGSGFAPRTGRQPAAVTHGSVGDTAWNMRGVARSPGSLLRFLREDVPGVTSPMLYVAMMFSWFAWHVEDHDLHSVNYMHSGAPKTWYGVPGDAALAFEDVVRVHGYGGEVNALETFAMLGNKTTVLSPEVLVQSGIPCCRLVQNVGEFVVTFPRAYHSGFSHGFNCGEASNIATPEWLKIAKKAAVRRASINRPPMVSHYQLLYELAMSMSLRDMPCGAMEPRSSRLKENKKCDGEQLVKRIFVRNVIEDNNLLSNFVNDGSSCVILPTNSHNGLVQSHLFSKFQSTTECRVLDSTCSKKEYSGSLPLTRALGKNDEHGNCGVSSANGNQSSVCLGTCKHDCVNMTLSEAYNAESGTGDVISAAGLLDQGLLSCVTCGILSFSCVAVIKPRQPAANFFMSADCSLIDNQLVGSHGTNLAHVSICGGTRTNASTTAMNNLVTPIVKPDKDSSRMHVFCLEHAAVVEKQLQTVGGAHIVLFCHPEYPKIEAEARLLAEEMKVDYDWKDIHFREASVEDRKMIQEVVRDEEIIPTNSDWAVKLGINLYYSANLAKSPLYSKQLPYNRVIYNAFGCSSPNSSPVELNTYARRQGRQKKVVLAGRWCGKVWMSNQVHPYLADRTENHDLEETYEICSYHLDRKVEGEVVDNSSREAASTTKRPKLTEQDNSEAFKSAAQVSTRKGCSRTVVEQTSKRTKEPVEKANTNKPKAQGANRHSGLSRTSAVTVAGRVM